MQLPFSQLVEIGAVPPRHPITCRFTGNEGAARKRKLVKWRIEWKRKFQIKWKLGLCRDYLAIYWGMHKKMEATITILLGTIRGLL